MADPVVTKPRGWMHFLPWALLWVAAPAPLWLALAITFWMRGGF